MAKKVAANKAGASEAELSEAVLKTLYFQALAILKGALGKWLQGRSMQGQQLPLTVCFEQPPEKLVLAVMLSELTSGYASCDNSRSLLESVVRQAPETTFMMFHAMMGCAPSGLLTVKWGDNFKLPEGMNGVMVEVDAQSAGEAFSRAMGSVPRG